ncbi:conserved hypothetical protein [Paecilomyces variotii No. 5]|uniref:SGNH hydrolase-type esterase domain-containing protein n=1 Tax=Byssochlamys spectabilis (strain No. 5 / NBRC 109023) TaxID=1356009 RepID=V5I4B1_BYSSN|nr:conserved hypothetical protein [Paecilomyces variotii No. 5]
MLDNEVEAQPGHTIDQVKAAAQNSIHYRPNLVLINAGTNDCRRQIDIPHAGDRMRSLIEMLLNAEGMERTTIILSTLIPSTEFSTALHRPEVNDQYRTLVRQMQREGVHIVLADMDPDVPSNASNQLSFPGDYTTHGVTDDTHPNEQGYRKMAHVWHKAVIDVSDRGFLQ